MANGRGGARPGAGRPRGSFNKLAAAAIEKAEAAPVHPIDFLLECLADNDLPKKERASAASALLPYISSKLSMAEINVTKETDDLSDEELRLRLEVLDGLILEQQPKTINGTAKRLESKQEVL